MPIWQINMNQPKPQHIVIVAGEESGDQHAAEMVHHLKAKCPTLRFSGVGGRHMEDAGVELVSDLARYGVMGIVEVIRFFKTIRRAFKAIQAHLTHHKPDLLILIDYPGFNLRLAKFAKQHGIRVLYYISPQIWAWKAGRIHTIRQCVDHMAVILPFEKAIYEEAGVPVSFIGHPLMKYTRPNAEPISLRQALNLPINDRIVAMLPGSRKHEIERHMPVLVETARRLLCEDDKLHFVIPVADTIDIQSINTYTNNLPFTLIQGRAMEVASCSDCIIVASGTASLECALLEKPMCIIYITSYLSYCLACWLVHIQYLGLCNILQHQMIVPEFIQYDCNAEELTKMTRQLLNDPTVAKSITHRLGALKRSLSSESADCTIDELVLSQLRN
jgi:lipid-A-disaccharide synthase